MILTDTSVLIEYLRARDPKLALDLPTRPVAVCGVVRAEILAGQRSLKHRAREIAILDSFLQVPIAESVWDLVGDHIAALRVGGLTLPFTDIAIATIAIANDIELWAR